MQFRGGFRTPSLFSFAVLCRATVGFGDEGSKRVGVSSSEFAISVLALLWRGQGVGRNSL